MSSHVAETGDDSGNPRLGWIPILLILAAVAVSLGLIAVYPGVQYGVASWGAHLYPPPLVP